MKNKEHRSTLKIIIAFILIPAISFCQKPRPYLMVKAVDFNYAHTDPSFGGGISLGVKGKFVGAGVGFDVIHIPNTSTPYAPVFLELSLYSNRKKARAYGNFQVGYGFFHNRPINEFIDQKGGLYFSPGIGLLLPGGKNEILLLLSYINSDFKTTGGYPSANLSNSTDGWALSLGIKF